MYACSRVWNKIHRTCSPLNLSLFNPQRDVRVLRPRSVQHDEIHHFAQGAVDLMEIQLKLVGTEVLPSGFP